MIICSRVYTLHHPDSYHTMTSCSVRLIRRCNTYKVTVKVVGKKILFSKKKSLCEGMAAFWKFCRYARHYCVGIRGAVHSKFYTKDNGVVKIITDEI